MRLIDADALKNTFKDKEGNEFTAFHFYEAIEKAPTIDSFGSWIPVEERLPEECENVLAWIERDLWVDCPTRTQEAAIGWHIKGRWHFDGYARSTKCLAWMPLPMPYEVKKNE